MHARTHPLTEARIADDPRALLLMRAAGGDAGAFALLARALAAPSLGTATKILGDRAAAEDVVQDALTKLWRDAHRFDPARGSFAGWWRRVLMNAALDGRRRLRPAVPLDEVAEQADNGLSPAAHAEGADIGRRVQAAARALPPRQRAALLMFHGEGLSMAEVADALETTEKAVEGLLGRARAGMRARLAPLMIEGPDG